MRIIIEKEEWIAFQKGWTKTLESLKKDDLPYLFEGDYSNKVVVVEIKEIFNMDV